MNKKTLEHIDTFINNTSWDILIKGSQPVFTFNLPSVDHLATGKKYELIDAINSFLSVYIVKTHLNDVLAEFECKPLTKENCFMMKISIKHRELHRVSAGKKSIMDELKSFLIFCVENKYELGIDTVTAYMNLND